jgi:hypothetical protein
MIKQLIFKNETLISALIVLCILVFSFVLKNQSTLSILILLILMLVAFLSLINFRIGVLVLASASASLNGFVRMYDLGNPVTAGFVFFLVLLLLSILLIIFVIKNKHTIPKAGSNFVAMYVLILCLLFIYIVSGSVNLLSFILYLREYFVPLLVFIIFFHVLKKDLYIFNKIIIFMVLPTAIVAIVNIYHYFFELDIVFNQYVNGDRKPAIRSLFGFHIPRLSPILGLGGEAAGGLYYMLMSILSLLAVKHQKIFISMLLITSSAILALASILTVSSSVTLLVISFVFWLSIFKLFHHPSMLRLIIFITVVPFLMLILFYPFGINAQYDSVFNYAFYAFIGKFLSDFQALTLLDHIVGLGLGLPGKGGLIEGAIWTPPDLWIFSLYIQFGLIGFVIFLTFWSHPLLKIIFDKTKLCQDIKSIHFVCGFIIIATFTTAHAVAILLRLFTPLLMLAFATFYVSFYYNNVKKIPL